MAALARCWRDRSGLLIAPLGAKRAAALRQKLPLRPSPFGMLRELTSDRYAGESEPPIGCYPVAILDKKVWRV
jgi:hypothetical protein